MLPHWPSQCIAVSCDAVWWQCWRNTRTGKVSMQAPTAAAPAEADLLDERPRRTTTTEATMNACALIVDVSSVSDPELVQSMVILIPIGAAAVGSGLGCPLQRPVSR